LLIATGSDPKTREMVQSLGHSITEPVPSLFTFNIKDKRIDGLAGVAVENVTLKMDSITQRGPVLITHWGMSGPAILRLSAWGARELAARQWKFSVMVNWVAEYNDQSLREKFHELRFEIASQKVNSKNYFGIPARLWEFLLVQSGIKRETRWADLPIKEQNKLIRNLCQYECSITGKTTFKEEFVTAGGIKLNEVSADTMMSK